ncbi:MAG: hypothetical protein K6A42_04945 [Treponema sp.]|nr:hypothetical protein [Treponema sp.]
MNLNDASQKLKCPKALLGCLLLLSFVFSFAVFLAKNPFVRYSFRFQSVDSGRNNIEWRLLPAKKGSEKILSYVEELLLGPKTERCRPIFSPGTKVQFCFERDRVLYVSLSTALLEKTGNASEIMKGIELFKKNIRFAFPYLKEIEIFIDKKSLMKD